MERSLSSFSTRFNGKTNGIRCCGRLLRSSSFPFLFLNYSSLAAFVGVYVYNRLIYSIRNFLVNTKLLLRTRITSGCELFAKFFISFVFQRNPKQCNCFLLMTPTSTQSLCHGLWLFDGTEREIKRRKGER